MTESTSGKTHIREAVRNRKANNAILARDIGVSSELLASFSVGDCDLPLDKLALVVDDIFHGFIEYNAELDKLQPVPPPPARSMGTPPDVTSTMTLPVFQRGASQRGVYKVDPAPPKQPKPGWLGIWG